MWTVSLLLPDFIEYILLSNLFSRQHSNVLTYILSGQEMEKVIENVQAHLQKVAEEVVTGKTPLQDFVITKVPT